MSVSKHFFLLLVVATVFRTALADVQCANEKSITLRDSSVTVIDYRKTTVSENPQFDPSQVIAGDTICLYPAADGISPGIKIRNFYDVPNLSAAQPITFVNSGGQVLFGDDNSDASVYIQNSRYLRLTGSGVDNVEYGFVIDGGDVTSQGIKIANHSTDIEVDHMEVGAVTSSGIHLIGLANCADASAPQGVSYQHVYDIDGDGSSQRGQIIGYDSLNNPIYDPGDQDDVITQNNFTMRNIRIHHNYIHDTGTEGMYLGQNMVAHLYKSDNTRGPAMGSEVVCNYTNPNLPAEYQPDPNNTNDPLNAKVDGIEVYANTLVNTGWDGINVKGGARNCAVYDNHITNHGWRARQDGDTDQTNGIDTTPDVYCDIYRNSIQGGGGSGIFLYGVGGIIANNLVIGSGTGGVSDGAKTTGIEIAAPDTSEWDLSSWYQGLSFEVYNNTVVSALSRGYKLKVAYSSHHMANNLAIATVSVPAGEDPGFIYDSNVAVSSNVYSASASDADLRLDAYYRPAPESTLVDAGMSVSQSVQQSDAYQTDLEGNPRIYQNAVDVGAYEWSGSNDNNGGSNSTNGSGAGVISIPVLLLLVLFQLLYRRSGLVIH